MSRVVDHVRCRCDHRIRVVGRACQASHRLPRREGGGALAVPSSRQSSPCASPCFADTPALCASSSNDDEMSPMSEMLYEFVEVVRVCRLRQIANRPLLVAHVVSTPTYDQGRALEDSLPEAVRLLELWIVHGDATNIIRARSTQPPSNVKLVSV